MQLLLGGGDQRRTSTPMISAAAHSANGGTAPGSKLPLPPSSRSSRSAITVSFRSGAGAALAVRVAPMGVLLASFSFLSLLRLHHYAHDSQNHGIAPLVCSCWC